jgi:hypothetical protein
MHMSFSKKINILCSNFYVALQFDSKPVTFKIFLFESFAFQQNFTFQIDAISFQLLKLSIQVHLHLP